MSEGPPHTQSCGARKAYSSRIVQTAKFVKEGIDKTIYEPVVRNRIGLATAVDGLHEPGVEHECGSCASSPRRIVVHIRSRCHAGIFSDQRLHPVLVVRHDEVLGGKAGCQDGVKPWDVDPPGHA